MHAEDFGSRLRAGDLVEVYHPSREDGSMHLLLVVSYLSGTLLLQWHEKDYLIYQSRSVVAEQHIRPAVFIVVKCDRGVDGDVGGGISLNRVSSPGIAWLSTSSYSRTG